MENVKNAFEALDQTTNTTAEVATPATDAKKKEAAAALKVAMQEAVEAESKVNPSITKVYASLSDKLEFVNSLGFAGQTGMIRDSEVLVFSRKKGKEIGKLENVPDVVGYRIKYTGDQPIKIENKTWTKGADGAYVGKVETQVVKPGEIFTVSRYYLAALGAMPEVSNTLKNASITLRFSAKKTASEIMDRAYITPNDDKSVHDDTVKIEISEKKGDTYVVKPDFIKYFGYLMNPKAKKERAARAPKETLTTQMKAAALIRNLRKRESEAL